MPANPITQVEADRLLGLPKGRVSTKVWPYPSLGGQLAIPLRSQDRREKFLLDVGRKSIDLTKGTYQNRARKIVVLARLDFDARPHRNPDGQSVMSPHLHLYREGYGDKWAVEVPSADFSTNADDPWTMLKDFMSYCNVVECPIIEPGLEPT